MELYTLNSFIIIINYGAIILLSFLSFFNPLDVNKKANIWFGIFLLLLSTFWAEEILDFLSVNETKFYFLEIIHFIQFFTPLTFYLAVVNFTNPNFKLEIKKSKHLIFSLIYIILQLLLFIETGFENSINTILIILIQAQAIYYSYLSLVTIRKHKKSIKLFSADTMNIDLNWLESIIVVILVISIVSGFYSWYFNAAPPNAFLNFLLLMVIFTMAYNSLKQQDIYPKDKRIRTELLAISSEEPIVETKRKLISSDKLEEIKKKLTALMEDKKPYLESDLNLVKLADLLEVTPHQLSYVINTGFNENFFEFINKYRVKRAQELLMVNNSSNLSILGVAFESGFNSKTSFNTTFKKITNQTPSEFKKRSSNL